MGRNRPPCCLLGWPAQAPFERIIVTAAAADVPGALVDQLAPGGVMVLPLGKRGEQQLLRLRRGESSLTEEHLGDVRFVPLIEGLPGEGGREPGLDALQESLATGPKRQTLA